MAGQSVTFDFLTRGADSTAAGFRKVGDNTVLAARGAKILADVIEKLGKKEDRTAEESAVLAKALRLTGDAEDRVAAKAVLADAAVRRLDDAMKDASKKPLIPEVISAPALAKLTGIKVRAEELKARFPEFTVKIDDTAAKLKLAALAVEAKAVDDAINRGFGNAGGGNRSLLSRLGGLFGGGGGAGGAGGSAGGAASGGGGLLTSPAGLGALGIGGALLAALTPAIAGLGIGGAVGGGAIAGGLFGAAEGKKTLNADLSTIKTLTIKLKTAIGQQKTEISAALKDAQKQYEKDAAFFAPFTAFQASLQGLAKTMIAPLRTVMAPLAGIFTQFGKGLTVLGPQLAGMFKASLPFVSMFLNLLLTAGKTLIPAFTGAMNTMVKSGALAQMSQGLVIIVNGLAGFITALGPGMASSATIFKGIAVIIAAVLRGLGLAFAYMANTFADNMHHIRLIIKDFPGWFDTARHEVAHIWDVMITAITATFDVFKENVRIAWDKIKLLFLQGVDFIMTTMGHLPGPLGQPFRTAHRSIAAEMAGIQRDVAIATGNIQADFNRIHGPPVIKVITQASGTGQIAITGTGWALGQGNIRFHAAQGAYIDRGTGPTADDVLVRASKGELIVPAHLVRAGAADNMRGLIPGFAAGGFPGNLASMPGAAGSIAGGDAGQAVHAGVAKAMAAAKAAVAARAAAALASAAGRGALGVGGGGPVGGDAGANKALARRMFPWGADQWPAFDTLEMHEAGYNRFARNPSSGAYGIPQAYPPTKMPFAAQAAGGSHAGPQLSWMYAYIRSVYGTPGAAWAQYYNHAGGQGSYALGGLVPGFASGGTVGRQGAAYLKAWKNRSGGGFGAAWGPVVLNQQIAAMAAAQHRAAILAGASGLTPGQHRYWKATAADEKKRLGVLGRELATERAWRGQLGASDMTLAAEIAAAGHLPHLAGPVKGWKAQIARQKRTIAGISKMLGYSDAQQAAIAKAHPPGKGKPPPVTGVQATHSYGGDVANNIGTVLTAALGPFTGAARGALVMDSGGTLRPGWNAAWNGTGRPEPLVPARSGGGGKLQIEWTGGNGGDELTQWIRKNVKIKGGGDVQKAYGTR